MPITPMPQFDVSAARYFSPSEIITLEEILNENALCGSAVPGTNGLMRRIRHPYVLKQSVRGFHPIVVYVINETDDEIILVDVIDGLNEFKSMMKDPWTWLKTINVARVLQAVWDKIQ